MGQFLFASVYSSQIAIYHSVITKRKRTGMADSTASPTFSFLRHVNLK